MTTASVQPSPTVDPFEGNSVALVVTALSSFATIFLTIVRSKVSAVVLGSAGIGAVAEVAQIAAMLAVPLTALAGPALTRALANAASGAEDARRALQTATRLSLFAGLVLPVLAAFAAWLMFEGLVDGPDRVWWSLLSGVVSWGSALCATFAAGLIASHRPVRAAVLNLTLNVALAIGSIIGTLLAGISGQFIGTAIGAVLFAPLGWRAVTSSLSDLSHPRSELDWGWLAGAIKVGAATLTSAFLAQGLLSLFRWLAFMDGGSEANGQLQAVMAVSSTYFGVVLSSLGAIAFPIFAAAPDSQALQNSVTATVKRILRLAPPVVLIAFALRVLAMRLLYSTRFEVASGVLAVQMAGDLPKAVAWALGAPLLLRGQIRAFIIADLLANAALAIAAIVFVPSFGLMGFGYAYVVGYVFAIGTNGWLLWRACHAKIPMMLIAATIVGSIAVTALAQIQGAPWLELLVGVAGMTWAIRVGALALVRSLVNRAVARLVRGRPRGSA